MTLVYYNKIADCIFVIEANDGPSLSLYYILTIAEKNRKRGWVYLGEL